MKKLLSLCFLGLLLYSCQKQDQQKSKRQYQCSYSYLYLAPGVVFAGFDSTALQSMVLKTYKGGTNLDSLVELDTIQSSNFVWEGDTAYAKIDSMNYARGFFGVKGGLDYIVSLPAISRDFTITGTSYGSDKETWYQDNHCSPGAGNVRVVAFQNIHIDGNLVYPFQNKTHNYLICLKK